MKNKIKIEYLLYLFVIITPFLDVIACVFREYFPNASISPSTIIRPIIPLILLMYIFFKDKKMRKYLIISGIVFILYGVIHLWIYKGLLTGISYGSVLSEAQYILNYTYMIYVLLIYLYFMNKMELPYLKKSLFIMLSCYLGLIFLSIITGTSYSTYLEGMGYRGWFISGNSLSTILILLESTLIGDIFKNKKVIGYVVLGLLGIYLLFLIGTRTGMLGFILVLVIYFFSNLVLKFVNKNKISFKKILGIGIIFIIIGGLILGVGSETINRRKHLKEEDTDIIDVNTLEYGHTTGDTGVIVYQIKNNELSDGYLSEAQKNAYLEMYDIANRKKLDSSNRRKQQIIYHYCLVKNQKNILYILFGNGYLANYGEMILEMELLAVLFNFGIIGFILYIGPFIGVLFYILKKMKDNKKKLNEELVMGFVGMILAFSLSCLAGYVFFSVPCVLVIVCILSLLSKEVKVEKN